MKTEHKYLRAYLHQFVNLMLDTLPSNMRVFPNVQTNLDAIKELKKFCDAFLAVSDEPDKLADMFPKK